VNYGNKSQVNNTEALKLQNFGTHCYTTPTKFIVPNGWTIEASCTTSCVKEESVVEGCTKVVINVGFANMKAGRGVVINVGFANMKMELGVVWSKGLFHWQQDNHPC
jgi:hypothetical protein